MIQWGKRASRTGGRLLPRFSRPLAWTPVALDELGSDLAAAPAFLADALCVEYPDAADAFFPRRGESSDEAVKLCARCLVRSECLDYALTHRETLDHGIWGGTTPNERRRLLKRAS